MYLRVRNKKSGLEFDTTLEEYNRLIASQGLDDKYEKVEDGAPIEVKEMRRKKQSDANGEEKKEEAVPLVNETTVDEPVVNEVVLKKSSKPKKSGS